MVSEIFFEMFMSCEVNRLKQTFRFKKLNLGQILVVCLVKSRQSQSYHL